MGKSKEHKPAEWLGRTIAHPDHVHDLERTAAINEMHHGLPRHIAEETAHRDYQKGQHAKAAAHHYAGMKSAHATNNVEAAKQHHAMYEAHVKALGLDANGPVPKEVAAHADHDGRKVYDFHHHDADQFVVDGKKE